VVEVTKALTAFEWTGMDVAARENYEAFLGEYVWAPSYVEMTRESVAVSKNDYNNSQLRWVNGLPVPLATTTQRYSDGGNGFDCSTSDATSGFMPSVWLARRMGLSWGRRRFTYIDPTGLVVAYDPSHERERGPQAFLAEREATLHFLREFQLTVIWLLIGEKLILNGSNRLSEGDRPVIEVFRQAYRLHDSRIKRLLRTACPLGGIPKDY
jgi:hypothetical protein